MLAKTGIEVHLMHEFMPPEPFLVFWQRTCSIHYFMSKTRVSGGFTQFRCRTGQITKTGYWLHTRLSHYSETFNKAIHTMSFVKRAIAKTSVGCIQGMWLHTRNDSGSIISCIKCTSIPVFASIKECLELLVNFMNKILIHETF